MFLISPLLILIFLPLVSLIFFPLFNARTVALVASFTNFIISIVTCFFFNTQSSHWQFVDQFSIIPRLGINFIVGADGLTVVMVLLSTLVTCIAICIAPKIDARESLYYGCLLLISSGIIGAFVSLDILFFYSFHELALIPTFLLVGIWGTGNKERVAWQTIIYLGLGSFILLIGLLMFYITIPSPMRTFDMRRIYELAASGLFHPTNNIFLLLFVGFGILISFFPFHSWAPSLYSSAPIPLAIMHAGLLKKFGLYGFIRIILPFFSESLQTFHLLILLVILGNIFYIGYITVLQTSLEKTISYSSVMHMGYILLGLISTNLIGNKGAMLLIFAHGLSVTLAFAMIAEIYKRTGTLSYDKMSGIATLFPVLGFLFGCSAMSSLGLPGFGNFAGEILIFFGTIAHYSMTFIPIVLAIWGVLISAIYMLRAYKNIFWGHAITDCILYREDITRSQLLLFILILIPLISVGVYPDIFFRMLGTPFIH